MKYNPDAVRVVFNKFKSAISFKPTVSTVLTPEVRMNACMQQMTADEHPSHARS